MICKLNSKLSYLCTFHSQRSLSHHLCFPFISTHSTHTLASIRREIAFFWREGGYRGSQALPSRSGEGEGGFGGVSTFNLSISSLLNPLEKNYLQGNIVLVGFFTYCLLWYELFFEWVMVWFEAKYDAKPFLNSWKRERRRENSSSLLLFKKRKEGIFGSFS